MVRGDPEGLHAGPARRRAFDKLSLGADPDLLDELHDGPFGTYGHLADRYGVHWFFRGDSGRNA